MGSGQQPLMATACAEVIGATPEGSSATGVVTAPVVDLGTNEVSNDDVNVDLSERLATMRQMLGLPDQYVQDLLKLVGTDIVVVADDSGSMNAITDPRKITEPVTRWEELQQTLRMLVTMLLVVEHVEGFWLKFLNDPEWYKVTDKEQLEQIFAAKPRAHGKTPLKANLEPIMQGYGSEEKDTLLLILTDGEPSDCSFEELSQIIRSKRADVYCSFAMCTDESEVVERYNQVVDPIPGCDITGILVCSVDDLCASKPPARPQMTSPPNARRPSATAISSRPTSGSPKCSSSSLTSTTTLMRSPSAIAPAASSPKASESTTHTAYYLQRDSPPLILLLTPTDRPTDRPNFR